MRSFNWFLVIVSMGVLVACAPFLGQNSIGEADDSTLLHVSLQIIAEDNTGKKTKFNVVWERVDLGEDATQDTVKILNPLGGTTAELTRLPEKSVLILNGKTYEAADANAFTKKLLGYTVPLDFLSYWIRGESSPLSSSKEVLSAGGRTLDVINQAQWIVVYHIYDDEDRPKKIELSSADGRAVVKINKWIKF